MEKRKYIITKVNNQTLEINNEKAFDNLAQFLRRDLDLPGTKIVCSEGDCGACTVLIGKDIGTDGKLIYKAVNSCILPLYLLDGAHVVTVEGIKNDDKLHEVQQKMVDCHGSQCGYCTPGFICSMTWMTEKLKSENKEITEKRTKNFLTGNLCRCTGYKPIIEAAAAIDLSKIELLKDKYFDQAWLTKAASIKKDSLVLNNEMFNIMLPSTLEEALLLKEVEPKLRIVAGNTDLGVLANKGKGIQKDVMSLTHVSELREIKADDNFIYVGATVTLSEFEEFIENEIPELKNLLHIFASPQIKNQGTLIGNVLNASPIGDTIPFLLSSNALVVIESAIGSREVELLKFYLGYKTLDLKPNELVTSVKIPRMCKLEKMSLFKISMRKDLDISAVTFAGKILVENEVIKSITLALGGVGPVVQRITQLESKLTGVKFEQAAFESAAKEVVQYISPLSDLRASKEYRLILASNFIRKFYKEVRESI